jgi:hypothetical protein
MLKYSRSQERRGSHIRCILTYVATACSHDVPAVCGTCCLAFSLTPAVWTPQGSLPYQACP